MQAVFGSDLADGGAEESRRLAGIDRTVAVVFHEPIIGGSAMAVLRVLPLLETRGWRFVFWAPGPGQLRDELVRRGYGVEGEQRLLRYSPAALRAPPGALTRLASVPGYLFRFHRWLRQQSPAVVHANTLITIPEALMARATGIPVMLYVHELLEAGLRARVAAALIRSSGATVITNSAASLSALLRRGVSARMAHYGVNVPAKSHRHRRDPHKLVVGTLGTISHRKGTDVFLAAAERVRHRLPGIQFRMIGPCPDGPEREWAQRAIDRARKSGIAWGTTSDPLAELAEWDLLVLPTRREPFGLVLIEAMAIGVPVVATRIDGPQEIVASGTGLLVELDDPGSLAEKILELACDPDRREAMGAAGRARVEQRFTLETQAGLIHDAYLDAASARARHRA